MAEYLLEMKNMSKSFPSVKALDGVTLRIRAGSVHALMGENGAGKSTLMKCLFGIYNADEGEILLDGKRVSFKNSKEALESGHLLGAGVDVLCVEPMTPDCPLFGVKNCLITPHIAWAGFETRERLMGICRNNVEAFLNGNPVNLVW